MSNNLDRTEVQAGQAQKEVTINESDGFLDAAITELEVFVVDDTNAITLTEPQFTHNQTLQFDDDTTPPDDAVAVTIPANQRGTFIVFNNMTFPLGIGISGQSAIPPSVNSGETRQLYSNGVDVQEIPSALRSFQGTLVNITGTQSILASTLTAVQWAVEEYEKQRGRNKFWLGLDATVTAAVDDNVTLTAHGMETEDGPYQFTTTGTLPAGLALLTDYWTIKTDANSFMVATSIANADAGTQVDITDTGTGVHTINRATRLVVPKGISFVRLTSAVQWAGTNSGDRLIQIKKNGATTIGGGSMAQKGDAVANFMSTASAALEVVAGDYFEVFVFQTTGNALNVDGALGQTWAALEEVR